MAVQRMNPFGDDPAVGAALGSQPTSDTVYDRLAKRRAMTPAQRKKAQRDAARSKVTYDLPKRLIESVEQMARETYGCPASHLAALLMRAGLEAVEQGRLDVYEHRRPSNSPRFEWFLRLDDGGKSGWGEK